MTLKICFGDLEEMHIDCTLLPTGVLITTAGTFTEWPLEMQIEEGELNSVLMGMVLDRHDQDGEVWHWAPITSTPSLKAVANEISELAESFGFDFDEDGVAVTLRYAP